MSRFKMFFVIAIIAVANAALAAETDNLFSQTNCAPQTSALPQSMVPATRSCPRISWSGVGFKGVRFEQYRYLDSENFRVVPDSPALVSGVVMSSKLPGNLTLALDLGNRTLLTHHWNPSRDPLFTTTSVSLGYRMNMHVEFGPHVTQNWDEYGHLVSRNRVYGLFMNISF